jgi:hypothetical protein
MSLTPYLLAKLPKLLSGLIFLQDLGCVDIQAMLIQHRGVLVLQDELSVQVAQV